ncbi:MAG: hypothetical protein ACI835_005745 [Planctomycetota bacterium]|jgi:hypothetical protein
MIFKSRLVKYLVIIGLVLLFAGYFAFSTFLFSPTEDDFEYDLAALIPRDVDFFVARADIGELFSEFPRLAVADRLEKNSTWEEFSESATYGDWMRDMRIEETLADLRVQLEQIPGGASPLDIFGGRDLAVAGYFRGSDMTQAEWAVYGRVNWMAKLGVAALGYPGLLGLDQQGLTVDNAVEWISISGGQLAKPIYISRIQDVVIVGTSPALVEKGSELAASSATDSLLLSARYQDHIKNADRSGARDEVELFVDVRKLLENMGQEGAWPDPASHFFTQALLGRLFQIPSCNELIGVMDIDGGLRADLHGEFSSELIDSRQSRMYRQRGFERDELLRSVAALAPADVVMFVYAHVPVGDLLRQLYDSAEPAARSNMDDFFKSTGKYKSTDAAITEIEGAMKNRFAFIVRNNDYSEQPGYDATNGPRNDGQPVFAISLVTWLAGKQSSWDVIQDFRETLGTNGPKLGLQGKNSGDNGYYKFKNAGLLTHEFWQPLIPGTGVATTLYDDEHLLISNSVELPVHVVKTEAKGGSEYPRLSERSDFQALLSTSLRDANAIVWINPRAGMKTLEAQAALWAEANATTGLITKATRQQEEGTMLREMFPGRGMNSLTLEERAEWDGAVTRKLYNKRERAKLERAPQLLAQRMQTLNYLKSISSLLVMLRLDPKEFDLSVRAVVPVEGQPE